MTIPTLSDAQRHALGSLIWEHVDGVTGNVGNLLHAINRDMLGGVRVVATQEWDKVNTALRAMQDRLRQLETTAPSLSMEHLQTQLRELSAQIESHLPAPKPVRRTPVY